MIERARSCNLHNRFQSDASVSLRGQWKVAMKNALYCSICLLLLFTVSLLMSAPAYGQAKYPVVEVKHLTKADSVDLSADYLKLSYDNLREELAKKGPFGKVVGDGETIADSDAANAALLECNIVEFKHGGLMPPTVLVDIKLSNRADHKVIQQVTGRKIPLNNGGRVPNDETKAKFTGRFLAAQIEHDLK